jgi:hypothetical protein
LRQLVALFILTAFLAQTFSKTFVVMDYYANTAAFAQNCENKARPAMHCNGKCQMMKKLKQQEKKEAENAERKGSLQMEVISSKAFFASIPHITTTTQQHFFVRNNNSVHDIAAAIFHPPAA